MTSPPPAPWAHKPILLLLLLVAFTNTTAAQETPVGSLKAFLAALEGSPELLAAQAAVEAAELQLRVARDPVVLEASGGYNRYDLDDALTGAVGATQTPPGPGEPGLPGGGAPGSGAIPESGFQLSTALTFRPYPFGDVADLVTQRELEYELRVLELSSARAGLEVRALEAALQARLAERSAELAQEGVTAAAQGLEATRLRVAKEAANARDLRGAEVALLEAQTALQNAQLDVQTARLNLESLVGDTPPPSLRRARRPGRADPAHPRERRAGRSANPAGRARDRCGAARTATGRLGELRLERVGLQHGDGFRRVAYASTECQFQLPGPGPDASGKRR